MQLAEHLEQVIADLELLNRATERDFLKIGGKLGQFIEAVNLISSRLSALANLISGVDGLSTSRSLEAAFGCFTEMRTHYKDRNEGLACMRVEAVRLRKTLRGFEEIVSNLNAIGFLTRIEIARLGNTRADFGTLASDMRSMTEDVQAKVRNALDTGDLLISPIESAMGNIAALDEKQVKDLAVAFGNLSAFRDIQNTAREASARLGARYDAISAAFRKLIVSIQFHDVTRQMVEHVIDALRRLRTEFGGKDGTPEDARMTAAVLALQSSQLADAAGKFAASSTSVARNLEDLASHIGEMADESQNLSAGSGDQGTTYFLQMERGCTAILINLRLLASADSATRITGGGMEENIGRMRRSIEEIRKIEMQMLHLARNATIAATHMGRSGDAINVLARSMGERATESRERSESLFNAIASMNEAAIQLFGQTGTAAAGRRVSQDASVEGMIIAVAELHTSGERSVARIAEIIHSGTRLRDDLSAARRDFSVGAYFEKTIGGVRGMLNDLGTRIQFDLPHDGIEPLEPGLADFATHYTMQAEHDVHAGVTGAMAAVALVAEVARAADEAGELGDNVEFF